MMFALCAAAVISRKPSTFSPDVPEWFGLLNQIADPVKLFLINIAEAELKRGHHPRGEEGAWTSRMIPLLYFNGLPSTPAPMTVALAAAAAASTGPETATLSKSAPRFIPATGTETGSEGFRFLLLRRRKNLQRLKTKCRHFVLHLIPNRPHLFLSCRDLSLIRSRLQPEFPQFIPFGEHLLPKRFDVLELGIPKLCELGLLLCRQIQLSESPKIPPPAGSVTGPPPRAEGQGGSRDHRRNEQRHDCYHCFLHLLFSFLLLRMVVLVWLSHRATVVPE
jgi:hypothetical protein